MIGTLLTILADVFFLIWISRNILFLTYLWQLKEYRFDRFFVHLKETQQGRELLFSPKVLIKWSLILIYSFTPYPFLVVGVFLLDAYQAFREVKNRTLRLPVFTLKALTIISLSFVSMLLILSFPLTNIFLWFLITDRAVPLLLGYFVFFLSIPTEFYRDFQITRATLLRHKRRKLTVIGVTGSYGKTSTKEFVASILAEKFSVLKTTGTNNTPIGIAMTILKSLKPHHEILVVEMGAYKKGEIRQLCQIVKPRIGILTAVNAQHLSLFGSLEKVIEGKYELIESLPKNGMALFNGNNQNSHLLYRKTKNNKYLYYVGGPNSMKADILATDVVVKRESIEFDAIMGRRRFHIVSNLLGKQNVENLLPGIFLAKKLGMRERHIQEAVASIRPLPMTMQPIKSKSGALFIDDTFNANPKALEAALAYLKTYRGRKILVLQPMIELGREAEDAHYALGKQSYTICDHILLTNRNFAQSFINGAREVGKDDKISVLTPKEIHDTLSGKIRRGSVVLFEGKEAGLVLKMLEGR